MKRKLLIILGIFILVTLITFVAAEEVYFNQCVEVYDSNGSNMGGLECSLKDNVPTFNWQNMTEISEGEYCVGINNSFPDGNYTFTSRCTDGNITRVVHGEFIVGASESDWNWLYIAVLLIPIFLIIIGKKSEDPIFTFFAGLLFLAFAPVMYIQGYPNFGNDFIFNAFALVIVGLGSYLTLKSGLEMIKGGT